MNYNWKDLFVTLLLSLLFLGYLLWSLDHFLQPSVNLFRFLNRHGYQLSLAYWYCSSVRGTFFCFDRKEIKKRMIPMLPSSAQANVLIYACVGGFVLLGSFFFGGLVTFFFPKNPIIKNGNKEKDEWAGISKS